MTFQILALIIIAFLVLFPVASVLHDLRRARRMQGADVRWDPLLRDAPRELVSEIVVLALFLSVLAIAVLMHAGPF